ncbi:Holliday junction resolvase RuvX [Chloroflexota bacterium]
MRVLAIDPGSKNIGLAISDPSGTIANPLSIVKHESRTKDTDLIAGMVVENEVELVIVGCSFDGEGLPTYEGRKAKRFASELAEKIKVQVKLWNEDFSTQIARSSRIQMGAKRKNRKGHLDDLAATIILQSFLDYGMNRKYSDE